MGYKFNNLYFKEYDESGKHTDKYLFNIVSSLPKNASVLDVGCGKCTFLSKIHKIRPDIKLFGVDIGDVDEFIPKYVSFKKTSGSELPFKEETFDFILCQHVLEHTLDPFNFTYEFFRTLKKEGCVYVETPYYKTAYIPDGNMNFWSDPTHVRPYNRCGMKNLLQQSGFSNIEVQVWRSYTSIFIAPWLILKRIFGNRDALSTLCAHIVGNAISGLGRKKAQSVKKQ